MTENPDTIAPEQNTDEAPTTQETNTARLQRAATALRIRGWAGDDFVADMLDRCRPIAERWYEQASRPFVPLLESALRVARVVLDDEPAQHPQIPPHGEKLIRMAISGELLGQILHLPSQIQVRGVDYYARADRADFLVHHPDAPPEAIRMTPTFERTNGWPDPIHLCDIRWGFPPGTEPAASHAGEAAAQDKAHD